MMKAILLLLVATCVFADLSSLKSEELIKFESLYANTRTRSADASCPTVTCASSVGANCNVSISGSSITIPTCTGSNTYCTSPQGTCQNTQSNGATCSSGSSCSSGLCVSSKCVATNQGSGSSCTVSAQCSSYNCASGSCAATAANGASCSSDSNCQSGYCASAGTCAAQVAVGASCSIMETSQCPGVTSCQISTAGSTTGTCGLPFTKTSGQVCGSSADCGDNLYCSNNTCSTYSSSTLGKNCNGASDCGALESCTCNYGSGQQTCQGPVNTASGTTQAVKDLGSCLSSKCGSTYNCAQSSCNSQYCNVVNKYTSTIVAQYSQVYPSCLVNSLKQQLPCSAGFMTVPSAVAVVAVAAIAMFF